MRHSTHNKVEGRPLHDVAHSYGLKHHVMAPTLGKAVVDVTAWKPCLSTDIGLKDHRDIHVSLDWRLPNTRMCTVNASNLCFTVNALNVPVNIKRCQHENPANHENP